MGELERARPRQDLGEHHVHVRQSGEAGELGGGQAARAEHEPDVREGERQVAELAGVETRRGDARRGARPHRLRRSRPHRLGPRGHLRDAPRRRGGRPTPLRRREHARVVDRSARAARHVDERSVDGARPAAHPRRAPGTDPGAVARPRPRCGAGGRAHPDVHDVGARRPAAGQRAPQPRVGQPHRPAGRRRSQSVIPRRSNRRTRGVSPRAPGWPPSGSSSPDSTNRSGISPAISACHSSGEKPSTKRSPSTTGCRTARSTPPSSKTSRFSPASLTRSTSSGGTVPPSSSRWRRSRSSA